MAYVPRCIVDVFISYAHENNHDGWVTRLRDELRNKLVEYLGAGVAKPHVWFDVRELRTGDAIRQEIHETLSKTAVLLAVLSPSYLQSEFCVEEEFAWFEECSKGELIMPVMKVPVPGSRYLGQSRIQDRKYLRFFQPGETEDEWEEFNTDDAQRFKPVLNQLAREARKVLESLRRKRQCIYVSRPDRDVNPELRKSSDLLVREFEAQGYRVVPQTLPRSASTAEIRDWLADSDLSIHLLSGRKDDFALRQLESARQLHQPLICIATSLSLSWLPKESEPIFLGDREWKQNLIERVERLLKPSSETAKPQQTNGRKQVYLLCESSEDPAGPTGLKQVLSRYPQLDIVLPDGSLQDYRAWHHANSERLQSSDAVLVYWGAASKQWIEESQKQIVQSVFVERHQRPFLSRGIFLASPDRPPQDQIRDTRGEFGEMILRQRQGQPHVEDVLPFIDELNQQSQHAAGGQS